jgi:ParB/RepB/Spo0J family partition protein
VEKKPAPLGAFLKEDFVEILDLSDISMGDRARKEYGDITELAESIRQKGLIQPIAVHLNPHEGPKYELIAGGRRYKAHIYNKHTKIMARVFNRQLDEHDKLELEIEENLKRLDMTPAEEMREKARLHALWQAKHGKKISPTGKGHSLADTAFALGKTKQSIAKDVQAAKMMEMFPDIDWNTCKTKNDVHKTIQRITNNFDTEERAQAVEASFSGRKDRLEKMVNSYVVGNFFERVRELPDESFDFVEIDPPYAINLTKQKKDYASTYSGYNEVEVDDYLFGNPETTWLGMQQVFAECFRVMNENSWGICWFGPEPWFEPMYQLIIAAGFGCTRLICTWGKGKPDDEGVVEKTSGQAHQPTKRLANSTEHFFYFWKGNPKLAKPGSTNHYGYPPVPPKQKIHPTERPINLIKEILCDFVPIGSKILVPFGGSGATNRAAFALGMFPLCYDLTQDFKHAYVVKIENEFNDGTKEKE